MRVAPVRSEHCLCSQMWRANCDEAADVALHSPCRAFVTPSMVDILFGAFSSHTTKSCLTARTISELCRGAAEVDYRLVST